MTKKVPQFIAAIVAAIGAFSLGTVLAWANVVQLEIESGDLGFSCSKEEFSWISSTFVLGAVLICVPAGTLINLIGRKWTMIVMCIPFEIGWFLLIFAQNLWMMYGGRFILGVAGASFCVSVPVYTGEIALKEVRGLLGTLFQFLIVCGILFIYVLGGLVQAKLVNMISCAFPILLAVLMILMPESPTHFVRKSNIEGATKSLAWLRGADTDISAELNDIKAADDAQKAEKVSLGAALGRSSSIRAMIISMMLMIFQQLSGINVVIFYSTSIFADANTGLSAELSTMLLGIVQVFATFASLMLVDRLGRRTLLLISAAGMGICLLLLGVYFFLKVSDPDLANSLGWLPVSSMCIYIAMFSIGYGPIPWIMMGEIFSADIKGFAGSVAATLNWSCAFVVTKTFVNLQELLGTGGTFMLFTGITLGGIFFVWFVLIETKGKSLNEIQAELSSLTKKT